MSESAWVFDRGASLTCSNTYTNKTWAELTGLPVAEITKMEAEFLKGLNYDLGVQHSEYTQWRQMLDGFIRSRNGQVSTLPSMAQYAAPPTAGVYTYTPPMVPSQYPDKYATVDRAWSASPTSFSPPRTYQPHYSFPSPTHARKRSAFDAFAADPAQGVYETVRRSTRRTAANQSAVPVPFPIPVPAHQSCVYPPQTSVRARQPSTPHGSQTALNRSTSLTRQVARMPSEGGRRGSAGQLYAVAPETDLRHAAAAHAHANAHPYEPSWAARGQVDMGQEYDGYSALVAPYDRMAQPHVIPPEVSRECAS